MEALPNAAPTQPSWAAITLGAGSAVGEHYRLCSGKPLGGGSSARVYEGIDVRCGTHVAVKCIDRASVEGDRRKTELLERELNIASQLNHPNVIKLLDVVFTPSHCCIVLELARGGELYDAMRHGAIGEQRARNIFAQLISAMQYCHLKGVCHRDIKLENLVLADTLQDIVKITDFGLSKDLAMHSQPDTKVGTISYMAPEVACARLGSTYVGELADIWSLGVILYVMVCCQYPFGFDTHTVARSGAQGESAMAVIGRIRTGQKAPYPQGLSAEVRHLVDAMLTVDPATRITIDAILAHPWMRAGGDVGGVRVAAAASEMGGAEPIRWPLAAAREDSDGLSVDAVDELDTFESLDADLSPR